MGSFSFEFLLHIANKMQLDGATLINGLPFNGILVLIKGKALTQYIMNFTY